MNWRKNQPFVQQTNLFFSDDKNTLYYTGLPTKKILDIILQNIKNNIQHTESNNLSLFQEFILFLIKLRLNSDFKDLGNRFLISESTASRIFSKWLNAFHITFKKLITWPERGSLMMAMALSFRKAFGTNVAVVVDCFELFINRPSSLITRAATWSNYKHHNIVKYLIGITPPRNNFLYI